MLVDVGRCCYFNPNFAFLIGENDNFTENKNNKRSINIKFSAFNPISKHPFQKKLLDNILQDAYEYITIKKMVKKYFLNF